MSAVIFDPAAAPSLEEYFQVIARKPENLLMNKRVCKYWLLGCKNFYYSNMHL
jgi:hypothetical protein